MGTLPDLDTGNISYIAYWNAIDQGGIGSIDPEEVLSDGNIQEYTLYDNGIQINSYQSATGRACKARVKTDGWIIAWFDRSKSFGTQVGDISTVRGWWDLVNDWTDPTAGNSFTTHTLERVVNSLRSQFSNAGTMTYNPDDTALYNYEYPTATATTGMSSANSGYDTNLSGIGGFSYTNSTNVLAAVAIGNGYCMSNAQDSNGLSISFEGVQLVDIPFNIYNYGRQDFGVYDLVENGVIPDSGTEYSFSVSHSVQSPEDIHSAISAVVIWE